MKYPEQNREITISSGDVRHRGDVVIGNTVIEFQHSPISSAHFQERTNFYLNAGYKVIWLFDFTSEYLENKIDFNGDHFVWIKPKSTFRDVTCAKENVDIFFQLSSDDVECIIRVNNISSKGFEVFKGSKPYSIGNWGELHRSMTCGCYHCGTVFLSNDICDWIGLDGRNADNATAICPFCGVNAVIPESPSYPLKKDFLEYLKTYCSKSPVQTEL